MKLWKKGRGKLGFLAPLLGSWVATTESPRGPIRCERDFASILGSTRIRLDARWHIGTPNSSGGKGNATKTYVELAVIGAGDDGTVAFWSFTSDGKRSEGKVADVSDLHPEAIGFEAQMPAGLARMAYWPDEDGAGFYWAVESKAKKGWSRFTLHHYLRA